MIKEKSITNLNSLSQLYSVLLLGGVYECENSICKTSIPLDKIHLLKHYILRHNLEECFKHELSLVEDNIIVLYFEETTLFKRLQREWQGNSSKIQYVMPAQLNVNVLNLWIALFGLLKKRKIYIPCSHFELAAKETFVTVFTDICEVALVQNGSNFIITNYIQWFAQAYKARRPYREISIYLTESKTHALLEAKQHVDFQMGNFY